MEILASPGNHWKLYSRHLSQQQQSIMNYIKENNSVKFVYSHVLAISHTSCSKNFFWRFYACIVSHVLAIYLVTQATSNLKNFWSHNLAGLHSMALD